MFGATVLAALLPSASAAPAAAGTATLEVQAGLRGWHDPGDHVVVSASISADEVFNGRVEVVAGSGAVVAHDVQVAGGTTKTLLLVAPTSLDTQPIDVRLYSGSELVSKQSVAMKVAETVELVGVLPALVTRVGELPEQANMATEAGKVQLAELAPEQMALGSSALDVFDSIVGTSADLRSLQPAQRAALLGWLNRGGRLLLDDSGNLDALPQAWRPGSAGWALAGRGEVRIVDGKASEGMWASIIEPSGESTSESAGMFGAGEQLGNVQQDLALRAGVKLPSMVPLLVPLVAYWAIVSVVLFFVLKSLRRLTLAWVAIPLLAALTALAVVWYGQQWRSVGKPAAATFVDGYPGGGDATTSVLTFSRDGGTSRVSLPAGWQSDSEVAWYFDGSGGLSPEVVPNADGTRLQVQLEPGQVTTANVLGPTTDVGLVASAQVSGSKVVGTVTNNSTVTLHQVAVFGTGGADAVGDLAPGQSAGFGINAAALPNGFTLADRVWRGTSAAGTRSGSSGSGDQLAAGAEIAELGIWSNASFGRVLYPSGMVRVAGWTTEMPGDVRIGGGLTTTTVVTSLARVQPGGATLPAAAVRSAMVRSPFTRFGNGTDDTVYRYVLPPEVQGGQRLVVELPVGLSSVEVWNGRGWVKAQASKRLVVLAPTSINDGVVMLRIPNDGMFFPGDQSPTVRGATAEDAA